MKRLVSQIVAMSATITFGIVTFAVTAIAPAHAQTPAPNFGSPPSGEIPILFNDQHVYTKPDRLKRGRVLAAYRTREDDPRSLAFDVRADGCDGLVQRVDQDGRRLEARRRRPRDGRQARSDDQRGNSAARRAAEIYHGSLLVPVRVISEGMGAYVLWVADRHLVVVRYISSIPPTPAPGYPGTGAAGPTAGPNRVPTPTPKPTAAAQFFVVGDAMFDPKVYNEFSPGNTGGVDLAGRAGATFNLGGLGFMAEGDYRQFRYPHRSSTTAVRPSACTRLHRSRGCDG